MAWWLPSVNGAYSPVQLLVTGSSLAFGRISVGRRHASASDGGPGPAGDPGLLRRRGRWKRRVTPPPEFTIALSVTPTDVALPVGAQLTLAVTVTRGGGYAGTVSLSVEGLPSYVTGTFEPASLAGTAASSTLTLATGDHAPLGTYAIIIRASGDGVSARQVTVTCHVTGGFVITPASPTVGLSGTGTAQLAVGITRTGGFADPVQLAVDGLPVNVTATFSPNPTSDNVSTLTLKAAGAALGTYPLTLRGSAPGAADRTAPITLQVIGVTGYSLAVSPAALTLVPPASGTAAITIQRLGGFAGAVSLFLEGQPAGVTPAFTPSPTTGGSATLTLATAPTTAGGTYTLTVRGEAEGQPVQRASLELTVQPAPGFWITISNPLLTLAAGGVPQTLNIGIDRTGGFAGAVSFTMSGLPAGFTASFSPASTTGTQAVLQVAAGAGVTPGAYVGTITASAAGMLDRTTNVTVTVIAAGAPVVWRFCSVLPQPVFFAYQDGASPYIAVAPSADGAFRFPLAAGRGAVIWVVAGLPAVGEDSRVPALWPAGLLRPQTVPASGFTTFVQYGTTSELQAMGQPACPASGAAKTVSGSVAGLGSGQGFGIGLGTAFFLGLPGTSSYTLPAVPDGAHDLIAGRVDVSLGPDGAVSATPDRLILRRNQNPADGSVLPVLDFGSAEAFLPATALLTLTATGGVPIELTGMFTTANGTQAYIHGSETSVGTSRSWLGVPTSRTIPGDLHQIIASDEQGRSTVLFANAVTARVLTMGPLGAPPAVSVFATAPVVRMRAILALGAPDTEYGGRFETVFVQAGAQRAIVVAYSRGAIGTTTSVEIRTPVLTGLAGWDETRYGLQLGATLAWTVREYSLPATYLPVDGGSIRSMTFQGQVVP